MQTKKAQQRGVTDWVSEKLNPVNYIAEKWHGISEPMQELRVIDDQVREQLKDINSIIKEARSLLEKRHYLPCVNRIARFEKAYFEVVELLKKSVKEPTDEAYQEFLLSPLSDEERDELSGLQQRYEKQANRVDFLRKQSGIFEWFTNTFTETGRQLAAWEKRYPNQVKKLKQDTTKIVSLSEKFHKLALDSLNKMSSHRNARDISKYVMEAEKIINRFSSYKESVIKYYNENVKDFLVKFQQKNQKPQTETQQSDSGAATTQNLEQKLDEFTSEVTQSSQAPVQSGNPFPPPSSAKPDLDQLFSRHDDPVQEETQEQPISSNKPVSSQKPISSVVPSIAPNTINNEEPGAISERQTLVSPPISEVPPSNKSSIVRSVTAISLDYTMYGKHFTGFNSKNRMGIIRLLNKYDRNAAFFTDEDLEKLNQYYKNTLDELNAKYNCNESTFEGVLKHVNKTESSRKTILMKIAQANLQEMMKDYLRGFSPMGGDELILKNYLYDQIPQLETNDANLYRVIGKIQDLHKAKKPVDQKLFNEFMSLRSSVLSSLNSYISKTTSIKPFSYFNSFLSFANSAHCEELIKRAIEDLNDKKLKDLQKSSSNKDKFLSIINLSANEHPYFLKKKIADFARSIENEDIETAKELYDLVKSI